jgi:ribonuclease BN (tRNA processing enzyme)
MPRPGGASSCYLIRSRNAAVLLDLGSGAAGKLQLAIELPRLDAVAITHMHADHFFDLVPLRYAFKYGGFAMPGRLPVWVPPGGRSALNALRKAVAVDAPPDFFDAVFAIREYDPTAPLEIKDTRLSFCRTRHYVEAYAVRMQCGGDSVTYSADTAPSEAVVEHARASSLFLCEAGLGSGTETGERGHSSAHEAGAMAESAGVARLVLTHYPAYDSPGVLVAAAKRAFAGPVDIADDGMEIAI